MSPKSPRGNTDALWASGIALTKNPWHRAHQSALGIHWAVNGGDNVGHVEWENEQVALIDGGYGSARKTTITGWVISDGKAKLLYFVGHNNHWDENGYTSMKVHNTDIGRLYPTMHNPLARHLNARFHTNYAAAVIPVNLVGNTGRPGVLTVEVDTTY